MGWAGERAARTDAIAPATVEVPVCGRCVLRRRAWRAVWVVLPVAFCVSVAARDRLHPAWGTAALVLAALCVAGAPWTLAGFDVVASATGVRWSFRKPELAEWFAADNGAVIESRAAPADARTGHDPDGVDHTGLDAAGDADD